MSFTLSPEKSTIRLLHLTDHHLFDRPEETLLGVNTRATLNAVINAVSPLVQDFDGIIDTGDFTQHENRQAYLHFAEMIKPLAKPLFWTVGNHDDGNVIQDLLSTNPQILPHKQVLLGQHWQMILLDSHIAGKPAGRLATAELERLAECLAQYPERFALIVMHHNILPTHAKWLDQHSLQNHDELWQMLCDNPNIKGILHGHIHQQTDSLWHGIPIFATPSTCFQFKAGCDDFTLDLIPPGWRELTLLPDGTIQTECKRLENGEFLPDMQAKGY